MAFSRQLLRDIVSATVASATLGCASSAAKTRPPLAIDASVYTDMGCPTTRLTGLSLPVTPDAIAILAKSGSGGVRTLDQTDVPLCGAASDADAGGADAGGSDAGGADAGSADPAAAACARRAATSPSSAILEAFGDSVYVAYSTATDLHLVTTYDELRAFLGPIDTPNEAALAALLAGAIGGSPIRAAVNGPVDRNGCAVTGYRVVADGYELLGTRPYGCSSERFRVKVTRDGVVSTIDDNSIGGQCGGGRRPQGFRPSRVKKSRDPVGRYFAEIGRLEAASVFAFRTMARELRAEGAPAELVRDAARAVRDERRHARLTRNIASRFGAAVDPPHATAPAPRGLEDVARENEIEGCVRETYGALVAEWAARRAWDREIASVMREIAVDEARHADLSWRVSAWARRRLGRAASSRLDDARRGALAQLRIEAVAPVDEEVVSHAGIPTAREGRALFDALEAALFV